MCSLSHFVRVCLSLSYTDTHTQTHTMGMCVCVCVWISVYDCVYLFGLSHSVGLSTSPRRVALSLPVLRYVYVPKYTFAYCMCRNINTLPDWKPAHTLNYLSLDKHNVQCLDDLWSQLSAARTHTPTYAPIPIYTPPQTHTHNVT